MEKILETTNKKNLFLLLFFFSPIFYNYFFNLLPRETRFISLTNTDFINIFISFLLFLYLFFVGKQIQIAFGLNSISFSIAIYVFSFFIIDNHLLFLAKEVSFKTLFLFINLLWFIFLITNKKVEKKAFLLFVLLSLLTREFVVENLISTYELQTTYFTVPDEDKVWLPVTTKIFESNYHFALLNFPGHSGYGLLISHISSLFTLICTSVKSFVFFPFIKNVFYFLTMLFIYEYKSSTFSKAILSIVLLVVTLNSHWFRYLLFNSLMLESAVSYYFAVLFYSSEESNNKKEKNLSIFLLGVLFFSKQFIALIAIFYIVYLFLIRRITVFTLGLGISGVFISFINYIFLNIDITWSNYFDNYGSAIELERTINYSNFFNVINQFLIDKPLSVFLFVLTILFFVNLNKNFMKFKNASLIFLFNTVLVFVLYIFIWTNVQIDSSYRYIINCFHLLLPIYLVTIDNFLSHKTKSKN